MPEISLLNGRQVRDSGVVERSMSDALVNDKWDTRVEVFQDTGGVVTLRGQATIPTNFLSAPQIVLDWFTRATVGGLDFEFEYQIVANSGNLDLQTSLEVATAAGSPAANALRRMRTPINVTATNWTGTAGRTLQWILRRRGDTDTMATWAAICELALSYS